MLKRTVCFMLTICILLVMPLVSAGARESSGEPWVKVYEDSHRTLYIDKNSLTSNYSTYKETTTSNIYTASFMTLMTLKDSNGYFIEETAIQIDFNSGISRMKQLGLTQYRDGVIVRTQGEKNWYDMDPRDWGDDECHAIFDYDTNNRGNVINNNSGKKIATI